MQVSVIIPVFNVIDCIERAVHSVLMQKEVGEILLIDDQSTDGSYERCIDFEKEYPIIRVLTHPGRMNLGVSASRNLGVMNAELELISFLDSDDYYLQNRFFHSVSMLQGQLGIDGVYEQVGILQPDNSIKPFSDICHVEPEALFENLQPVGSKVWFHCNGLTMRKNSFIQAGLFDTSLKTSEDSLHWFKLAVRCRLQGIVGNQWVAIHQKRECSLSSDKSIVKKNYHRMFFMLYQWSHREKLTEERCDLVLEKFMLELYRHNEFSDHVNRLLYLWKVFIMDPNYFMHNKVFRRFFGRLIGYI